VYHGFQILSGVAADGFTFGKITDFETAPCDYGMRLSSRQTIVVPGWFGKSNFQEVHPLEPERWGVWGVTFPYAIKSHDHVRKNLESILPELKKRWEEWRQKYSKT
jgi:hypothetical protein